MITIPTHNSNITFIIDDEDYARISQYKWYATKQKEVVTIFRTESVLINGYYRTKTISIGQEILSYFGGQYLVDHKDRNRFNNSKSNLRLATWGQNHGEFACLNII